MAVAEEVRYRVILVLACLDSRSGGTASGAAANLLSYLKAELCFGNLIKFTGNEATSKKIDPIV